MKKLYLLLILSIISFSSNIIDKVIYNGKENTDEVFLNTNIRKGDLLDISEIDNIVDNFKFVKNNDIKVNIEPSNKDGEVNLVLKNTKTNPFFLSV